MVRTGQVPAPGPHIPALRPPASLGPRGTVASGWAAQRKALAERAAGVPVAVLEPQPFPAPKGSPGKKDGIFWDEPVSEGQEAGTPILGWERWDPGGQALPSEGGQTGGQDEGWRRPDTGGGGRHVSDSWGAGGRADASVRRTRERSAPPPGGGRGPQTPGPTSCGCPLLPSLWSLAQDCRVERPACWSPSCTWSGDEGAEGAGPRLGGDGRGRPLGQEPGVGRATFGRNCRGSQNIRELG